MTENLVPEVTAPAEDVRMMAQVRPARAATVYQLDPLADSRWTSLIERHPHSSAFHAVSWLEALRRTYGYEPVAFTTAAPGARLDNAVVFCRVNSWLTGRRLVSLPFSDHCEPLVEDAAELSAILAAVDREQQRHQLRYVELRPVQALESACSLHHSNQTFCFHQLDLTPDLNTLFANCHKDSTQRKVRRAEREGLIYEEGRTKTLLDHFLGLLLLTRRRHQVPPQPREWFQNLIECLGESLKIRVAYNKERQPTAAILTLRHKTTMIYKYGCSDTRFNNLGGMHLLFWKTIQEAKEQGARVFDLGRSDLDNEGLITFKDRWGCARSELVYSRFTVPGSAKGQFSAAGGGWKEGLAKTVFSRLPDRALNTVGQLIYKHIG